MLNHEQVATRLAKMGWGAGVKNNTQKLDRAIRDFQQAWNLGQHVTYQGQPLGRLYVDGKLGGRTSAAIEFSTERWRAGQPTASNHFSFAELCCKGSPLHIRCARVRSHVELLHGLEVLSRYQNVDIVSGYRCVQHNSNVGGASSSQHVYGAGVDINPVLTFVQVARLGKFSGIGVQKKTGKVRHVDVRHVSGNNTTGGTPSRPTKWFYP